MARKKNPAAVALGRKGGKANTEAQNAARRENGKKGGRPRKQLRHFPCPECGSTVFRVMTYTGKPILRDKETGRLHVCKRG